MEPTEAQPNGDSWFGNILNQNSREAFASFHCPGKKVGRCVDRHGPWMLTGLDVQFVNQDGEYQLLTGNQRFHHACLHSWRRTKRGRNLTKVTAAK